MSTLELANTFNKIFHATRGSAYDSMVAIAKHVEAMPQMAPRPIGDEDNADIEAVAQMVHDVMEDVAKEKRHGLLNGINLPYTTGNRDTASAYFAIARRLVARYGKQAAATATAKFDEPNLLTEVEKGFETTKLERNAAHLNKLAADFTTAFNWGGSSEGHDFWRDVVSRLKGKAKLYSDHASKAPTITTIGPFTVTSTADGGVTIVNNGSASKGEIMLMSQKFTTDLAAVLTKTASAAAAAAARRKA